MGYEFDDDDDYHDLAVGAPGDGGGRVHLIPGSSPGLDLAHGTAFTQQTEEIPDDDGLDDEFGAAVGAMGVGYDDALVIGVPGEDTDQGAIVVLVVDKDLETGTLVAIGPALVYRPMDAGLQDAGQARWGEVIAPPRAFPTKPVDYP